MPFTSILYANGPGYVHVNGSRENITMVDYCKWWSLSAPRLQSDWCLPFVVWKKKRKWCLWYSFHHPLISPLVGPHCLHIRHVKSAICLSGQRVLPFFLLFVPHPCLSHRMSVYIWGWKYFYPPMVCFSKPTNFLPFWLAWRRLMFLQTSDCVSRCTFFESK